MPPRINEDINGLIAVFADLRIALLAVQDVRTRAADCLGKVTQFSPRVDPIINDLCKAIEAAPSPAVQESTVEALQV